MSIDDMVAELRKLEALKLNIEQRMFNLERGLLVAGVMAKRGRPPVKNTHTVSEAREAHRRHQRGDRTEWVVKGERQYQREIKRARKLRVA